ncbi:hypothetical protein HMPREF1152_1363 [Mogibacterium sp. CM50]|uniref:Uncharacterized protein n=1 Tax=Mogibacterium timidum ATCC 33093 TaxID=1401079 RepID=X8IPR1_9FIRM|nr:hypothetical protein HMPREF1152_1363 [Mogibacterium sp. CM50]EUC51607.1 hypothetical protein HMPREF0581_1005 [Mogibacterium timidum ATCC 33093]
MCFIDMTALSLSLEFHLTRNTGTVHPNLPSACRAKLKEEIKKPDAITFIL